MSVITVQRSRRCPRRVQLGPSVLTRGSFESLIALTVALASSALNLALPLSTVHATPATTALTRQLSAIQPTELWAIHVHRVDTAYKDLNDSSAARLGRSVLSRDSEMIRSARTVLRVISVPALR